MTSLSRQQQRKVDTQRKLLSAARKMMAEGTKPSISKAAKRAGISTATAYRYYSDPDQMNSEAALEEGLNAGSDDFLDQFRTLLDGVSDPTQRLLKVQRQMLQGVSDNRNQYRNFIAQAHLKMARAKPGNRPVIPGGRRILILELALEPARPDLDAEALSDLLHHAMLLCGPETYFTLYDYAQLDDETIVEQGAKAMRALAATYLKK